jgi:integrase
LTLETLAALREWKLACPNGPLGLAFPNTVGKVAAYNSLTADYGPIQMAAKVVERNKKGELIGKYGLHALRHASASLWIASGYNPKQIQVLMGHASIEQTYDGYGHLFADNDEGQRAAARVAALLG